MLLKVGHKRCAARGTDAVGKYTISITNVDLTKVRKLTDAVTGHIVIAWWDQQCWVAVLRLMRSRDKEAQGCVRPLA
jgi:hypothetical protein